MTSLRIEIMKIPGVLLGGENPLPVFRDSETSYQVKTHSSLPLEKTHLIGWEIGYRVLPYRLQDNYTRDREPVVFRSIVLENELLKATFLPELGGRLVSLLSKSDERELLYRNPVFQPANLAIRNAWFSGGIEWNIGQFGHTFTTCSPVFAASIKGTQGEPGLRLYEFERCKRLIWQIDFYLPPGSPWLIVYTRIINLNDMDTSIYWWTNIAVPESDDIRVLAPARDAIYADFSDGNHVDMAFGSLPYLPSLSRRDATYPLNSKFANEFFFQCDETDLPWETALDKNGSGLIEASTTRLRFRKLFCWGSHQGGRHWQEFLSPGGKPYIEIQAGLAPTQLHGLKMPARAEWDWAQVFGCIHTDPKVVHSSDWDKAWKIVDATLRSQITPERLSKIEFACRERANLPGQEILQSGSGWGALEIARHNACHIASSIPPSFVFPESSLGKEESKWLHLLQEGNLPEQSPATLPGDWMVQDEWCNTLETSLKQINNRNWYALLHLGVMRMEHFNLDGAESAWVESIEMKPSSWAWRNLAQIAIRRGNEAEALDYLTRAWELSVSTEHCMPLAQEYLSALFSAHRLDEALAVYNILPESLQKNDRIQILRAQIALELGDLDMVEKLLQHEYAIVREGETVLTDIWFELCYKRHAARTNQPLNDEIRALIQRQNPPPPIIDFRNIINE
jgi:hypothetical protein